MEGDSRNHEEVEKVGGQRSSLYRQKGLGQSQNMCLTIADNIIQLPLRGGGEGLCTGVLVTAGRHLRLAHHCHMDKG